MSNILTPSCDQPLPLLLLLLLAPLFMILDIQSLQKGAERNIKEFWVLVRADKLHIGAEKLGICL